MMPRSFRINTEMAFRLIRETPRFFTTTQKFPGLAGLDSSSKLTVHQQKTAPRVTDVCIRNTHTLFHPVKNYSPDVAAKIGALKRFAKFQHNIKDSINTGAELIRESQLFSQLILACSAYDGLSKTQHDFTLNSIRYYNNAPLDGSKDTINIRETIVGSNHYYLNDKKKSSITEVESVAERLASLIPDLERQQILKRSALFVAIQIMAFDRPFSERDRAWSQIAAQILGISAEEENALVSLSLLDHQYTPLGPKPAVDRTEFAQVAAKLDVIEEEFESFYSTLNSGVLAKK